MSKSDIAVIRQQARTLADQSWQQSTSRKHTPGTDSLVPSDLGGTSHLRPLN